MSTTEVTSYYILSAMKGIENPNYYARLRHHCVLYCERVSRQRLNVWVLFSKVQAYI